MMNYDDNKVAQMCLRTVVEKITCHGSSRRDDVDIRVADNGIFYRNRGPSYHVKEDKLFVFNDFGYQNPPSFDSFAKWFIEKLRHECVVCHKKIVPVVNRPGAYEYWLTIYPPHVAPEYKPEPKLKSWEE